MKYETQEAASGSRDQKLLKPSDYPGDVDHYQGDWKTKIRKSKSLVPGF